MSKTTPQPHPPADVRPDEVAARALGHNPFTDLDTPEPWTEQLDAAPAVAIPHAKTGTPVRPIRTTPLPKRAEIELPEPASWVDSLMGDEERRVLAAFEHLVEGESRLDRFGFSPEVTKRAFVIFHALYRGYFRVESRGHEHIPVTGPCILASNHAGLLPFDAAMTIVDLALHSDPPRLARAVVDRWAGALPFVNVFYSRVGQIVGTRENFANLLDDNQLVLVFPEGMAGAGKTIAQRYRLQRFHKGFVEQALRAQVPIVPMAVIGSDDQSPILFNVQPLAKRLGLPIAPITPTFPWLGPLGLLPFPVKYRIVYGKPLDFSEQIGPDGASDAKLTTQLTSQVRRHVQQLIDRNTA